MAYPTFAPNVDPRDAHDAIVGAVLESARRDPDRFFAVLEREPSLVIATEVLWALGGIDDARAIPILIDVLRSGDALVRWSAAHGLEKRHDPRVVDAFIAALSDRAPTVRAVIVEALGKFGDARAAEPLAVAAARKSNTNDAYLQKLFTQAIHSVRRSAPKR